MRIGNEINVARDIKSIEIHLINGEMNNYTIGTKEYKSEVIGIDINVNFIRIWFKGYKFLEFPLTSVLFYYYFCEDFKDY